MGSGVSTLLTHFFGWARLEGERALRGMVREFGAMSVFGDDCVSRIERGPRGGEDLDGSAAG